MPVHRGTDEWLVVEMHSRGFPYFLKDLERQESVGFDDAQCAVVRDALTAIFQEANRLGTADLLRSFVNTYDEFRQTYTDWNGRGTGGTRGDMLHRRVRLEELIDQNRRNTRSIRHRRKLGTLAVTSDDAKVARFAYKKFRDIVNSNPAVFSGLASSVDDFESA